MECVTVLKTPDLYKDTAEFSATACSGKSVGKSGGRRLCSRDGQTLTIGILLFLLMLSLVSQLILWNNILSFREELHSVKEKLKEHEVQLEQQSNYEKWKSAVPAAPGRVRNIRSNTCPPSIPHFYMRGNGKEAHGENRFLWNGTGGINTSGQGPFIAVHSQHSGRAVSSVQITEAGVYFIYIQIKVYGRSHSTQHPAVGYSLKRNIDDTLSKAILTQDEMGVRYGGPNEWPVDTLTLSGTFYLQREDVLSITPLADQVNDHHIRYRNDHDASHFGGFMLERSGC